MPSPLHIISLLFTGFAARELRLERVHSRPGSPCVRRALVLALTLAFALPKRRGHLRGGAASVRTGNRAPLVRPALFSRARAGLMYGMVMLQFATFIVWAFGVQLYYKVYIGYSPVRMVVRLTPMFVTGLICNIFLALVIGRVPALWLPASGTLTSTLRGVDSWFNHVQQGAARTRWGRTTLRCGRASRLAGSAECIAWEQSRSPLSP
ncbi:hypothetical protein B0H17DRAFT_1216954 [Mycena rosella]|uniref:Uncharacterized protein n=1 Tax=Mycena rosella TaxID=1033263 RepID=A0AAD7C308_MYCRO|nr:hypothetical protein B0H17DRAFT_1216954 [Mycena rosella]